MFYLIVEAILINLRLVPYYTLFVFRLESKEKDNQELMIQLIQLHHGNCFITRAWNFIKYTENNEDIFITLYKTFEISIIC